MPKKDCNTTFKVAGTYHNPAGFTQYKLLITTLQDVNKQDLFKQSYILKRYNEFRNLHRSLFKIHKDLYLPGDFPDFVKPQLFGRFDENVLKERVACIQVLFDFVCQHKPLYDSNELKQFCKNCVPVEYNEEEGKLELPSLTPVQASKQCNASNSSHQKDSLSTSANYSHYSEFDPLSCNDDIPLNKVKEDWLAVINNTVIHAQQNSSSELSNKDHTNFKTPQNNSRIKPMDVQIMKKQHRKISKARAYLNHVQNMDESLFCSQKTELSGDNSNTIFNLNKEFKKSLNDLRIMFIEDKPKEEINKNNGAYLAEAAYHISLAQDEAVSSNPERALNEYNKAITTLIKGVQCDVDERRVETVRKKITKYIRKSEKLKNVFFHKKEAMHPSTQVQKKYLQNKDVEELKTSSPRHTCLELENYKVIRLIGKNMLVIDNSSKNSFVVKVLEKQMHRCRHIKRSLVPKNVPYMVKLHKYFNTDCTIYLVLEHITGGKLWDQLNKFKKRCSQSENVSTKKVNKLAENETIKQCSHEQKNNNDELRAAIEAELKDVKISAEVSKNIFLPVNQNKLPFLRSSKNDSPLESSNSNSDEEEEISSNVATSRPSLCGSELLSEEDLSMIKNDVEIVGDISDFNDQLSSGDEEISKNKELITTPDNNKLFKNRLLQSSDVITDNVVQKDENVVEYFNEEPFYRLPEDVIRGWAAEIIICIGSLHSIGILCHNLNKNKLLLNENGHIRMSYCSKWKYVRDCNQNDQMSPEILTNHNPVFTQACDWWSLGVVLFELFTGKSLKAVHPCGFSPQTVLRFPVNLSYEARSLLTSLLQFYPSQRLGSGPTGLEDLMNHPFFIGLDWKAIIKNGE